MTDDHRPEPPIYYSATNPDGDFDDAGGSSAADVEEAFATWRAECARADEIVTGVASLDERRPHRTGEMSVRWVLVHMVEEYARHNGHADLLRERIDGAVGE